MIHRTASNKKKTPSHRLTLYSSRPRFSVSVHKSVLLTQLCDRCGENWHCPFTTPPLLPTTLNLNCFVGGQTGYFQQPGNSSLSSAQLPQHQAGYGLQGTVFGSHSQSHNSPSLQGYNNHFLSAPIQIAAAAAALSAQQYRSQSLPGAAYLKGVANQGINEQAARPQQLKSPGSQQEVLSSVFNSCKFPLCHTVVKRPKSECKWSYWFGVGLLWFGMKKYVKKSQKLNYFV